MQTTLEHSSTVPPLTIEATAQQVLEHLPHAVVVINSLGLVSWYNQAMLKITKVVVGQEWASVLSTLVSHFSQEQRYLIETTPMPDQLGQLVTLTDTTQRTVVQQQAADQYIQGMRAAIAHQLRTPLSAAIMNLSCIEATEAQTPNIERLQRNLTALKHEITNMMLMFDGKLAHQQVLHVNSWFDQLRHHFSDQFSQIQWHCDQSTGELCISETHLRGAIHNLIYNAVQASKGASVHAYTDDSGYAIIDIKNAISCIEPNLISRITKAFASSKNDGCGIGVNVAQKVIEAHSGSLTFSTKGPINGAGWLRARIRLPIFDRS